VEVNQSDWALAHAGRARAAAAANSDSDLFILGSPFSVARRRSWPRRKKFNRSNEAFEYYPMAPNGCQHVNAHGRGCRPDCGNSATRRWTLSNTLDVTECAHLHGKCSLYLDGSRSLPSSPPKHKRAVRPRMVIIAVRGRRISVASLRGRRCWMQLLVNTEWYSRFPDLSALSIAHVYHRVAVG